MKEKKTLVIIILLLVLLIGGAYVLYNQLGSQLDSNQLATENKQAETNVELQMAPDFTVYDVDGNAVQLSDYQGKPVVLNFWSSRCGPCQMEMPDFQKAYDELGEEIQFMMVNVTDGSWDTLERATEFISGTTYTFPVYYDTERSAGAAYGTSSLPATYFIDAEGHAVAYGSGALDLETLMTGIEMIYSGH